MRKIFTSFPLTSTFELSSDDAHHVVVVLRHKVGDSIAVTDSTGTTYDCSITRIENHAVFLAPAHKISDAVISNGKVILAAGLLKNDKFEWIVQKAVELGADRIIPVQMDHCVVKLNEMRQQDKIKRWQKIALEAAKQCGRNDVPEVTAVFDIPKLVKEYSDVRFVVPYEQETASFHHICQEVGDGDVVICIGPEGGFDKNEIALLCEKVPWCRTVSLGTRILRAETAAIAAISIIMYERGFK
jgi:16S rRNA (uracil1498-N3)-methyltransferase